jgi:hypothetical protein
MALGIAILIGSLIMDRLERQGVNPYTVPGLLPGLLGIAMILLGGILTARSVGRGGLVRPLPDHSGHAREERRRVWMVIAMCVTFGVVLVGRGLPFWLAAWAFVTFAILVLQRSGLKASGEKLGKRAWFMAGVIGLGAGVLITLVFQEIFLVHLP